MSESAPASVADPFGADVAERLWRRLAGVATVVVPVAAGLVLWTSEVLPWVLLGASVAYVLGVPASWLLTRHGGRPIWRHVAAATVLGGLVAAALATLSLGDEVLVWFAIFAVYSIGIGVPIAAMAAWAGMALPDRVVRPVAGLGLLVVLVGLPVGTWLEQRPPAPYDFVLVHEPELISAADAYEFARLVADRFEQRAAAGEPRTAHATRVEVTDELSTGVLANVASWQRVALDEDLPTLAATGERVRPVTVIFEDEAERACVVLTEDASWVERQGCAELDLTG